MSPPNALSEVCQIALTVSDVAKAKHFYGDILGLQFLFDAGPNLSFLSAGNVRIMLTLPEGPFQAGRNSILYFKADSLDATYAAVVGRGATAESKPHLIARMPDHELWLATVRDPDGNPVGLMEERR